MIKKKADDDDSEIPPRLEGESHNSFDDLSVGIGFNADGKLNSFPLSQLNERTAERTRYEAQTIGGLVEKINAEQDAQISALEAQANALKDEASGNADLDDLDDYDELIEAE